jgi:murein DD-endopeptidase MepM/ murein hydrolase activator NlpD
VVGRPLGTAVVEVAARRSIRPLNSGSLKQALSLVARLFPERQIVLRTGLRRRCFTISTPLQAVVAVAAAGATLWQATVTAQWLCSAAIIAHKNYQIVDLRVDRTLAIRSKKSSARHFRNVATRITSEIEEIQRNLAILARHDSMTSKPIAAYPASSGKSEAVRAHGTLEQALNEKLAHLEESLRLLRSRHSELLATSAQSASVQLDRVESALATAGIDTGTLLADSIAVDAATEPGACAGDGLSCGGPFIPDSAPQAMHATMQRWDDLVTAMSRLPLGAPVENVRLTSGFGRRLDPFHRRRAVHAGVDYAGPARSPVFATGAGSVSYSGRKGPYGNLVEIDHGNGFFTRYAHLAEISVKVGQEVERGTQVGLVGSTGRSTGPHLHYEVRVRNDARDPLKFIGVGRNVFKRYDENGKG